MLHENECLADVILLHGTIEWQKNDFAFMVTSVCPFSAVSVHLNVILSITLFPSRSTNLEASSKAEIATSKPREMGLVIV